MASPKWMDDQDQYEAGKLKLYMVSVLSPMLMKARALLALILTETMQVTSKPMDDVAMQVNST